MDVIPLHLKLSVPLLQGHFSCSEAAKTFLASRSTKKPAQVAFWLKDSEHTPTETGGNQDEGFSSWNMIDGWRNSPSSCFQLHNLSQDF